MAVIALASVEQVKGYLGIAAIQDDALIERLVNSASGYIQRWLGRDFGTDDYVDRVNGNGSDTLLFRNYPVTAVSELVIDGAAISEAASPFAVGYVWDENAIYLRGLRYTKGRLNVSVAYTAGYAADAVPHDVTQACIEMVAMRYREKDRIGLTSKGLAGETTGYSQKDMADSTRHILNQYRRVAPL